MTKNTLEKRALKLFNECKYSSYLTILEVMYTTASEQKKYIKASLINEIGANVIKDLKKIKNKVLFKGNEENFWEHIYDLPQTYTLNKYEQRTTYFITELYEDNGELLVKAQDNEEGNEETFNIRQLSTETLIDILYFEPIENNQ
jgi:hypothetical protein